MKRIIYAPSTTVLLPNVFGDGSDGDLVVSSSIQITEPMNYRNVTVLPGGSIRLFGWPLFVQGTLLNQGTIHANGNNASGTSGASASSLNDQFSGQAGANGRTTVGNGASTPDDASWTVLNDSDAGGSGGSAGANLGGAGAGGSGTGMKKGNARNLILSVVQFYLTDVATNGILLAPGGGGGGNASGGGTNSGAGGAGAGWVHIRARQVNNADGIISANGGNGSAATGAGNAGGGGGGCGGLITIYSLNRPTGTLTVNAGSGGAGVGTGAAGAAGDSGVIILAPGTQAS